MNSLKKKFAVDLQKERDGITHDLGDGITITVARLHNENHAEALTRLKEPYRDQLEMGVSIDEAAWKKISIRALAETVLIGWSGVKDGNKTVSYSAEAAEVLLSDPEMKDFYAIVLQHAANAANYRKFAAKATEKN